MNPDLLAENQFRTKVFPAELDAIRQRRQNTGLPQPSQTKAEPSLHHDLFGLSLSGGGIRSASFALGVLQALAADGLLPRVDYLSTVSGGGLIGSTVSGLLNSPGTSAAPDRFPLGFDAGKIERPAVRYLRNHTRWLAPGGTLDGVRLPAILLRGMIDNFALLLPALMIAVLITEGLFVLAYRIGMDRVQKAPIIAAASFAAIALLQPILYRLFPERYDTWSGRDRYERVLTYFLFVAAAGLVLVPVFLIVQQAIDLDWDTVKQLYLMHRIRFWVTATVIIAIVAIAARYAFAKPDQLIGKISLLVVGLLGHAFVFGLYLVLTLVQVHSPVLDAALLSDLQNPSGTVTEPLARAIDAALNRTDDTVVGAAPPRVTRGDAIESASRGGYRWWVIHDTSGAYIVTEWRGTLRLVNTLFWDGNSDLIFFAIGVAGLLYAVFFANSNITSPHGFFRDRMSRAFLFAVWNGRIEQVDDLKLSALNGPGSTAPYHLLNVTLNLQGEPDADLGGRDADFFILSKQFSGSPTTGYCETTKLEARDRHLNVGTAMAISGAGVAPNEGTETIKPLTYMTALLNLRLDYWLANPRRVLDPSRWRRLRLAASVGPLYLLKEAFGLLDASGAFVNVSDGGHLENLALYELLRRRCRWIIAVDATEDPSMGCGCLMDALRYARIDLGIAIAIDVNDLHLQSGGAPPLSRAHWAIGDIDYGEGEIGHLVYVKASMTGDEPATVVDYRSGSPTFPQESSANQFFSEKQFEAYRALGEHITQHLVASKMTFPWPVPVHVDPDALREEFV
jgi:predicted acylesterase/phospholipase RssA